MLDTFENPYAHREQIAQAYIKYGAAPQTLLQPVITLKISYQVESFFASTSPRGEVKHKANALGLAIGAGWRKRQHLKPNIVRALHDKIA